MMKSVICILVDPCVSLLKHVAWTISCDRTCFISVFPVFDDIAILILLLGYFFVCCTTVWIDAVLVCFSESFGSSDINLHTNIVIMKRLCVVLCLG